MPLAGWSCGRAPRPAPATLHQSPRNGRWSILDWLTKVVGLVDVLAAVGRVGPPQPLRGVLAAVRRGGAVCGPPQPLGEVSISIPMPLEKPALIAAERHAWS